MYFIVIGIAASLLKLLLIPCYRSTDFEVHRNWLAITYSLPLNEWYFEDTSEWTLDYPPFFAYFEWILAQLAVFFDPLMLQTDRLLYASEATIVFQRLSVIMMDSLLIWTAWLYLSTSSLSLPNQLKVFVLVVFNVGLLLVDHMHFQYNGFLFGVLFLCIYYAKMNKPLHLATIFSCLVLLKHLFVPLAPPFAVYLIQSYCFTPFTPIPLYPSPIPATPHTNIKTKQPQPSSTSTSKSTFSITNFLKLVTIAATALTAAFGPFVYYGGVDQLRQIISRLFPFGRGLVHAYWAPNVWALYCLADKMGAMVAKKLLGMVRYVPRVTCSLDYPLVPPQYPLILSYNPLYPLIPPHTPLYLLYR